MFLRACRVPGTILGAWGLDVNKKDKTCCPQIRPTFCFVLNTHHVNNTGPSNLSTEAWSQTPITLKTYHMVWPKRLLYKECKNQIKLDVPVGWKGERRWNVCPSGRGYSAKVKSMDPRVTLSRFKYLRYNLPAASSLASHLTSPDPVSSSEKWKWEYR